MGFWQPEPNLSGAPFPTAFACCFRLQSTSCWTVLCYDRGRYVAPGHGIQPIGSHGGTWVIMIIITVWLHCHKFLWPHLHQPYRLVKCQMLKVLHEQQFFTIKFNLGAHKYQTNFNKTAQMIKYNFIAIFFLNKLLLPFCCQYFPTSLIQTNTH